MELPIGISVNMSPIQISRDDVAAAVSAALGASGISGDAADRRADRKRDHPGSRARRQGAERAEAARRPRRDGRFRHRLHLARLDAAAADRRAQDRPALRRRDDRRRRFSAAIVHAILSLAKALGMETTAEGIESAELARGLAELGCTYGQGFHFAEAAAAPTRRSLTGWSAAPDRRGAGPAREPSLLSAGKARRRPVPLDRLQGRRDDRPGRQPHRDQVAAADRAAAAAATPRSACEIGARLAPASRKRSTASAVPIR